MSGSEFGRNGFFVCHPGNVDSVVRNPDLWTLGKPRIPATVLGRMFYGNRPVCN
jgi:hypothetical protein